MTLIRTNRDKYSTNNTVLPGIRRVQIDSQAQDCLTTPTIVHLAIPTANTEVTYIFPANTKLFKVKSQNGARFQILYNSGGDSYTVPSKNEYCMDSICVEALTIYFQSPKTGVILEIESWV